MQANSLRSDLEKTVIKASALIATSKEPSDLSVKLNAMSSVPPIHELIVTFLEDPQIAVFIKRQNWNRINAVSMASTIQRNDDSECIFDYYFLWQDIKAKMKKNLLAEFHQVLHLPDGSLETPIAGLNAIEREKFAFQSQASALLYYCVVARNVADILLRNPTLNENPVAAIRGLFRVDDMIDANIPILTPGELDQNERQILYAAAMLLVEKANPEKGRILVEDSRLITQELLKAKNEFTNVILPIEFQGAYIVNRLLDVTSSIALTSQHSAITQSPNVAAPIISFMIGEELQNRVNQAYFSPAINTEANTIQQIGNYLESQPGKARPYLTELKKQLTQMQNVPQHVQERKEHVADEPQLRALLISLYSNYLIRIHRVKSLEQVYLAAKEKSLNELGLALKKAGNDFKETESSQTFSRTDKDNEQQKEQTVLTSQICEVMKQIDFQNPISVITGRRNLMKLYEDGFTDAFTTKTNELRSIQNSLHAKLNLAELDHNPYSLIALLNKEKKHYKMLDNSYNELFKINPLLARPFEAMLAARKEFHLAILSVEQAIKLLLDVDKFHQDYSSEEKQESNSQQVVLEERLASLRQQVDEDNPFRPFIESIFHDVDDHIHKMKGDLQDPSAGPGLS